MGRHSKRKAALSADLDLEGLPCPTFPTTLPEPVKVPLAQMIANLRRGTTAATMISRTTILNPATVSLAPSSPSRLTAPQLKVHTLILNPKANEKKSNISPITTSSSMSA